MARREELESIEIKNSYLDKLSDIAFQFNLSDANEANGVYGFNLPF